MFFQTLDRWLQRQSYLQFRWLTQGHWTCGEEEKIFQRLLSSRLLLTHWTSQRKMYKICRYIYLHIFFVWNWAFIKWYVHSWSLPFKVIKKNFIQPQTIYVFELFWNYITWLVDSRVQNTARKLKVRIKIKDKRYSTYLNENESQKLSIFPKNSYNYIFYQKFYTIPLFHLIFQIYLLSRIRILTLLPPEPETACL